MTSVNRFFNSPFFLGFEHLERLLERTAKSAGEGYPPYNIEEIPDGGIAITLAVAGFAKDELAVTVEDRQLVIRGRQTGGDGKTFLHRGIAARQFLRSLRAGGRHRSQICRVGKWIVEESIWPARRSSPACGSIEIRTGGLIMTDNFRERK